MRILLSGGGTGGHINPALAVANYIKEKEPDTKFLYVGGTDSMEERLVPKAGFEFKGITVSGFQRKISIENIGRNIRAVARVFSASVKARKILKEFKPDVCFGTGGYVCGPILREAAKMGIPIFVHESNSYPGMTTKMLSKHAKCIMICSEDAKEYLKGCRCEVTGNPVRPEILKADKKASREALGVDFRPLVLSFGGSLGAQKINDAVSKLLLRSANDGKYQHIHGYGQYSKQMPEELKEKGLDLEKAKNIDLREYINNMDVCLSAADLVICRAGAITLSELRAQGKAAILIPSPNVAENHQYHNAMSMVKRNAARIIEEKDLIAEKLIETVDEVLEDLNTAKLIGKNAKNMAILDANERIYRIIKNEVKA